MKALLQTSIIFIICFCFTRSSFAQLSVALNSQLPLECDAENGYLNALVTGGTPPYSYQWSNGSTATQIIDLAPGVYTLTVTDMTFNTASDTKTITAETTFNLYYTYWAPTLGNCDGGFACVGNHSSIQYSVPFDTVHPPYFAGDPAFFGTHVCQTDPTIVVDYLTQPSFCPEFNGPFTLDPSTLYTGPFTLTPAPLQYPCSSNTRFKITNQNKIDLAMMPQLQFNNPYPIIATVCKLYDLSGNIIASYTFGAQYLLQHNDSLIMDFGLNVTGTYIVKYIEGAFAFDTLGVQLVDTFQLATIDCGEFTGNVFYDENINCLNDGFPDILLPNTTINIQPINVDVITNNNGHFAAYLPYGSYTATHTNPYNMGQECPTSPIAFTLDNITPSYISDFADTTSANIQCDLSTTMHAGGARPGFDYHIYIRTRNLNLQASGTATLTLDVDTSLVFVSANNGGLYANNAVTWNVASISAFDFTNFSADFNIPPTVPVGTILTSVAEISQPACDTIVANNIATYQSAVTASFDPNQKSVSPVGVGPNHIIPPDHRLQYLLEFENTGNDTAFKVVLIDTLSPMLDPASIMIEMASHDYLVQISQPNVLKITFDNILLPDSTTNPVASKGYISFSIDQMPGLTDGTVISNDVGIYFDYNVPVITNTVVNTIKNGPVAVCQNVQTYLDSVGNNTIVTPEMFDSGSYDFYGIQSMSLSQTFFNCNQIGSNAITFYVTNLNGIIDSCQATVTVIDSIFPVAVCHDITVQLDSNCVVQIMPNDIDNGSSENCPYISFTISQSGFTCNDIGLNPVTLTVGDASGNLSQCTAIVTVVDATGIHENYSTTENLLIAPNPSSGILNLPNYSLNGILEIMELTGKVVYVNKKLNDSTLNLSQLTAGCYLVQLKKDRVVYRAIWTKY